VASRASCSTDLARPTSGTPIDAMRSIATGSPGGARRTRGGNRGHSFPPGTGRATLSPTWAPRDRAADSEKKERGGQLDNEVEEILATSVLRPHKRVATAVQWAGKYDDWGSELNEEITSAKAAKPLVIIGLGALATFHPQRCAGEAAQAG